MEIKVGEYVKLERGEIFKIDEYTTNYYNSNKEYITNEVVKHSKNIIDLIEVGDFVNGQEVVTVYGYDEDGNDKDELGIIETDDDFAYGVYLTDLNIRTILTHEQYEQNCYRLEE